MARQAVLLALAVLVGGAAEAAAGQECAKGDLPCWCEALGGEWKPLASEKPAGMMDNACRVHYKHAGLGRYVHAYLPKGYDGGTTPYPLWVQLHGVFWSTMGDIGELTGRPVNATDVSPSWDAAIRRLDDAAVIVYPQSLGDPGTGNEAVEGQGATHRQFWSIPFWKCSVGICAPTGGDDVGFIEALLADLPRRFRTAPGRVLLGGESAGGMLVYSLLCRSRAVAAAVTAAVDVIGGVGKDFALGPDCRDSPAASLLSFSPSIKVLKFFKSSPILFHRRFII